MQQTKCNSAGSITMNVSTNPLRPFNFPSIFVTNANHVLNKMDELFCIARDLDPTVICITESWLDDGTPDSLCQISGYALFRNDRKSGQGG